MFLKVFLRILVAKEGKCTPNYHIRRSIICIISLSAKNKKKSKGFVILKTIYYNENCIDIKLTINLLNLYTS